MREGLKACTAGPVWKQAELGGDYGTHCTCCKWGSGGSFRVHRPPVEISKKGRKETNC